MSKAKSHGALKAVLYVASTLIGLAIVVIVATNVLVVASTQEKIVSQTEARSIGADCILVLGASVLANGTPSGILQDRLDIGIEAYFAGVAPKIIMSGDNGTESYNEVLAMKNYAIGQGVPSEDIFCDHAGFSTYESMYRAKHVFGAQSMVVVTQTYHLYRGLYDANGLGIDAVGISSDVHTYQNQLFYDIREVPARTKDYFLTLFHAPSKFVGDAISLDQSGDITEG